MSGMQDVEVLRAACCVAGADKQIAPEEMKFLQQLADRVGVGEASLGAMIEMATCDSNFCSQQFRILTVDPHQAMEVLVRVAFADGTMKQDEADVLKTFAQRLGLSSDDCRDIVTRIRGQ